MCFIPSSAQVGRIHHALIGSTNQFALELFEKGHKSVIWVTADEQSKGKGRRGQRWVSPKGNFYGSFLLIDPAKTSFLPQLAFIASLALHKALAHFLPADLRLELTIKWPNDLLFFKKKVAGILLEGAIRSFQNVQNTGVVMGFGVNCASHPDKASYPVTDFAHEGIFIPIQKFFEHLHEALKVTLNQWNKGCNFAAIRQQWLERASGLGRQIVVRRMQDEIQGHFHGLSQEGQLLLRLPNKAILPISAGEIFIL